MRRNEKAASRCSAKAAHEKPDPNANLDRNRSPRKSTREARLLSELHAAALAVAPGRTAFVTTASSWGWFRVERLDALTARVSHVSETFVVETLLADAQFLDAEPLGRVA
jgi:hypothetical protein